MGALSSPKLDIARQRVAEAEADIARQRQLIEKIEMAGRPSLGARTLLRLFEDVLEKNRAALDLIARESNISPIAAAKRVPGNQSPAFNSSVTQPRQ